MGNIYNNIDILNRLKDLTLDTGITKQTAGGKKSRKRKRNSKNNKKLQKTRKKRKYKLK
jgi:hypothetical protein